MTEDNKAEGESHGERLNEKTPEMGMRKSEQRVYMKALRMCRRTVPPQKCGLQVTEKAQMDFYGKKPMQLAA